jgi:hypothetical protein
MDYSKSPYNYVSNDPVNRYDIAGLLDPKEWRALTGMEPKEFI